MRGVLGVWSLITLAVVISWVANIVKLTECDFAAPYRCEVVHIVGIIPLAAPVTVWFDTDEKVAP